jgi:aminopeptidase YwaD
MKRILYISITLTISALYSCNSQINPNITLPELKSHLEFLAGDKLKGRYPGTPEDSVLMNYISNEFKSYGLSFFGGNGIQNFDFISNVKQGPFNLLEINGLENKTANDFMPYSFSSSVEVTAPVVFAGYGFNVKNDTIVRDDYAGVDVKGKWVLIFRGNPFSNESKNVFSGTEKDRDKVMLAKDKSAAGVLLVSGSKFDPGDELNAMASNLSEVGLPCFQVSRGFADKILFNSNNTISQLESKLFQKNEVNSFETNAIIKGISDVIQEKTKTGNVIAYIKGNNPVLAGEYIVLGAHHDHLGMGGQGSSSRMPDTIAIHYGADDNASGVSALLEIAEKFSSLKPGRSIIFITFGAEERGIIGSNYFTAHSPISLENIDLMLNLDMVGRLRDSSLQIGGVGTSTEFKTILNETEKNTPFKFSLSEAGYGPSDHAAFYAKDKPVLFFSTGAHQDYHTPNDKVDSINLEGLREITSYVADLALYFSNQESKLVFQEAGPKESTSSRYRGKITFGIMPDVSDEGTSGMKVLGVTLGKPAANSGMKKGDIITAINGKAVGNIQDYMFRLGQLKPGEVVIVTVLRNTLKIELLVQL